jgi:hypothetical protein
VGFWAAYVRGFIPSADGLRAWADHAAAIFGLFLMLRSPWLAAYEWLRPRIAGVLPGRLRRGPVQVVIPMTAYVWDGTSKASVWDGTAIAPVWDGTVTRAPRAASPITPAQ